MSKIKSEYQAVWQKAYDALNEKQKEAVDTIDGPVMTIAGPGTGKTQLLAVRIGNILIKTDVFAHNILCLTYTDAGAVAMRKRLSSFIGPDAYNVNIQTFHAFCNSVIKENPKSFGNFRELQSISEIEEIDVYRSIIDTFGDNHPLKRFKGDVYYEWKRLKTLFGTMKQEKWTPAFIKDAYERHKSIVTDPALSTFIYQKKYFDKTTNTQYEKGDLNPKNVNAELARYENVLAACGEFEMYNKEMAKRERFDYQDMILWVIDKFKTDDTLLGKYQERFQYILVDEFQDTNGAQNELLFLLAEYWEDPNLFIVGDDDQSIFRFQGANMNSIIDFKNKFSPKEIVLTANYRSSQKILDRAKRLIENNSERLVNRFPHLTKYLTEARRNGIENASEPQFLAYQNETQEEAGIIQKISELYESGVPYNEMAIIYTKHRIVENLIRYFSQKKIPINVKKRVNVLGEVDVVKLINILRYIQGETVRPYGNEDILFEILHYDFFTISALDIAAISIYCKRKSTDKEDTYLKWREVLKNRLLLQEAGVKDIDTIIQVANTIETWISDIFNVTIQTLIEKVLTDGNILNTVLYSPDKAWRLQLLNTFFDFVKNEASKSKTLSLKQLIQMIDIMVDNNLELPIYRIISNEKGINFMSAHGAKGLEFDHVFIMRSNSSNWEKKIGNNGQYAFPPTLTTSNSQVQEEDDRRLMYVAMTRAKNYLYISYPLHSDEDKKLEPSKFVAESILSEDEIKEINIPDDDVLLYKAELMRFSRGVPQLIEHDLIDHILENFKLSATSLNKYLKCKLTFYFETILRVPLGRSATMGFGNAIHYALEHFFRDIENSVTRSMGSVQKLLEFYTKGLDYYKSHFTMQEFENLSKHGTNILTEYYETYSKDWLLPRKYEVEYEIKSTEYQGVPISGKLDRINIYDNHISVTDYKTGRYDSKKLKPPTGGDDDLGGDYWRQIMFYRLLLDGDKKHNWVMTKGVMDFIEKGKNEPYKKGEFEIASFETEIVGTQLVQAYQDIKNHIFTPGCGEDTCKWCNFVTRSMPVQLSIEDEDSLVEVQSEMIIE
jgi:DNA helicase II / ATP-dependent DNA helicase PcrA